MFEKTSQIVKPRANMTVAGVLGGSSALVGDAIHLEIL